MKATIIGWYGTETIGDRAILAGVIKALNNKFNTIFLGSLYPFFTERTITEDKKFYEKYSKFEGEVALFDSKIQKDLEKHIDKSDVLIMGGGPLMHIGPLHLIDYAFQYAKKKRKKTIILGCGVGPIFKAGFAKVLFNIFKNSDEIILRDSSALDYAKSVFQGIEIDYDFSEIRTAYDPSVLVCLEFLNSFEKVSKKDIDILLNLRDFPKEYAKTEKRLNKAHKSINKFIEILGGYEGKSLLLPNHYFFVGCDDRDYFNNLKFTGNIKNVDIQNKPLNLEETFEIIVSAKKCIGMRFHTVVFQTLLNGNNYVLDYTEPEKGKIIGFLKDINFNFSNYMNLQKDDLFDKIPEISNNKIKLSKKKINSLYLK